MQTPTRANPFNRGYFLGIVTAIAVAALWSGIATPPPAQAQIPDSGAQRHAIVRELQVNNQRLSEAVDLLKEIRDLQKNAAAATEKKKSSAEPK